MKRVYKKQQYIVYRSDDCGFILVNILMPGFAHTHLESFEMCKKLIVLSLNKRVPRNLSNYLLKSLLRVNSDEQYCQKINELLENRKVKQRYFNSNRGVRDKNKP
jgi:hypothetical protein